MSVKLESVTNVHVGDKCLLAYPNHTLLDLINVDLWSDIAKYCVTPLFAFGKTNKSYPNYSTAKYSDKLLEEFIQHYNNNMIIALSKIEDNYVICIDHTALYRNGKQLVFAENIKRKKCVKFATKDNTFFPIENLDELTTSVSDWNISVYKLYRKNDNIGHYINVQ